MENRCNFIAHLKRLFVLWLIMGMVYFTIEGFWRGWTNIVMLFIGGICGILIGLMNQFPRYVDLKIWQQCLFGTAVILFIEFISGGIFNLWLGWNLWDYSETWGNLYGQICLPYAALWFVLCPLAIWLDDWLRWKLFNEGSPYNLSEIYLELITWQ